MKSLVTILTAFVLVVGLCSVATAGPMNDSANWGSGWEFDTDPTGSWTEEGSPSTYTTVNTSGAGTFEFRTHTPDVSWQIWDTNANNVLGSGDWSYEISLHQISSKAGNGSKFYAEIYSSTQEASLNTRKDAVTGNALKVEIVLSGGGRLYSPAIGVNESHIWRVTRTDGTTSGGLFTLYMDDNTTAVDTLDNFTPNAASGDLDFGNGLPTDYDLDYIRWNTTGAYEPVPEPVTLALLGLGGLAVLLRRRRK
jgi:hypothetical protein